MGHFKGVNYEDDRHQASETFLGESSYKFDQKAQIEEDKH